MYLLFFIINAAVEGIICIIPSALEELFARGLNPDSCLIIAYINALSFKSDISVFHEGIGYNPPNNNLPWLFLKIAASRNVNPGILFWEKNDSNFG